MMLDKKQILFFEFKMDCKAVETAHSINSAFSPGEHNSAKETRALKGSVATLRKLTTPIERIIETDPLTTTQEVAQELSVDHFMVIQHLKQIER